MGTPPATVIDTNPISNIIRGQLVEFRAYTQVVVSGATAFVCCLWTVREEGSYYLVQKVCV